MQPGTVTKRGWLHMEKGNNTEEMIPSSDFDSRKKAAIEKYKQRSEGIAIGVISTLLIGAAALLWFNAAKLPVQIENLEKRVDNLDDQIGDFDNQIDLVESNLNSEMNEMKRDIRDDITDLRDDMSEVRSSITSLQSLLFSTVGFKPTIEVAEQISYTYGEIDHLTPNGGLSLTLSNVVAYSDNGTEFTADQLVDLKLLLPYRDGNQEVFFYGQYDEENRWDGDCLVNIYENGKLKLITDAVYENGKLLTFKQAFPDTTTGGENIWTFSERTVEDDFSTGRTWHYFRNEDKRQNFKFDDVTVKDMISADGFLADLDSSLEGYYCGVISDGYFNDDTGIAYMVKYCIDGTVKTLYVGNFANGQFEDDSGNAWMIGKLEMGKPYSYYKGIFKAGNATESGQHWVYDISIEQINEILAEAQFQCDCDLVWQLLTI